MLAVICYFNYFISRIIWFGIWLLPSIQVFGQPEKTLFQHLNIENGLSNNSINGIVQDDNGFIWIATDNGLNKYNGYSSKVYYPNSSDSCGDLKTSIGSAFKDSKGRLWFSGTGLILCHTENEKFSVYSYDAKNLKSINSNDIFKIVEDEFSNIWIGTRNGLARFNETTNDFTRFIHDTIGSSFEVYSRNRVIDMVSDREGNLWITTNMGLYQFSLFDHSFKLFMLHPEQQKSRKANQSQYLCHDRKGKLWISYYGYGVYQFDCKTKCYSKINFPNAEMNVAATRVSFISCDSRDNIWIATSFDGILYYNAADKEWQHVKHDVFNPKSLSENNMTCLFEDCSGLMWIGTNSKGVDRINLQLGNFINYVLQPGKPNSLCESDITCFCEDQYSNLWIGSRSGLMYFNRSSNQFTCYKNNRNNINSLSDNCIYSIEIDSLNNLLIATENGLNYFNPKSNRWIRYNDREGNINGLPSRQVFDVKVRKNGEVWLATSEMVCRFEPKTGTFINRRNNANIEKLPHAFYTTLFEDRNNSMWLSTARSGIYVVDNQFNLIHSYRKSGGFFANMVHQFNEDVLGTLWMASDQGVYYKIKGELEIRKLITSSEILNGDIKSIQVESPTKFWVSTLRGLIHFTLDSNKKVHIVKIFTEKDGLQSRAFNNFSGKKLRSGELVFGGINGFNLFQPSAIHFNNYIPQVRLTRFAIHNQEIHIIENDKNQSTLNLNYDQNDFSFEMASLNYHFTDNNQYGYQLAGYDNDVNYSGTSRFAQYTNVPPGKYQLKVIGSNNDGLWNQEGYAINLVVHPPYWNTIWFRALMILLIGFTGSVIYSRRINAIRNQEMEKAAIEKKIAEARSIALRAQMNPHFIFNSLNSIQHLISESDKLSAQNYLSKFSRLMRLVLENSNKSMNTVGSEIEMLELYLELETLRFINKFSYEFQIGEDATLLNTEIPSMLLHPFVENAVLHGLLNKVEKGHLKISLYKSNDQLTCEIEDNGIGREAADLIKTKKINSHKSFGLQVTMDRVDMIETITNKRAQIKIEDLISSEGKAMGTRIIIEIPIETQI